ncbi:hypothetical protein GS966_29880 [Rhodococcus hoagii]|nr:hypothetical protein [Prescottella equi]
MILLGARLAMARSGAIRDTSEEGFRQMARATLVAGTFTSLVVLGTRLSDGIANWFMEGTVGEDPRGLVERWSRSPSTRARAGPPCCS